MDGPPYATGKIHMGTALNKILKDIAMRSQRLQGKDVFDRPGYDTHGVPIEIQVEKEIGSKSKKDIEKFGVKNFVERCKEYATKYIGVMNEQFMNLGVWMDWENPYLTLDDSYMESIWAAFKEADKKGLLYLGQYPAHICTRCGTTVAFNEIEYGKQKDTSVFVKFPLKDKKNSFLIIWTTTPWTLPANTGVMVNPEVVYQEVELSNGEKWILAKDLAAKIMGMLGIGFTLKNEFKGKEMNGWKYENPLSKYLNLKIKKGYMVVLSARYVTTEDGTGLVHCAPGHGKEDFEVGRENGLDMPSPVGLDGNLTNEAGKYAGKKAREVDREIIADLEKDGCLVYKLEYEHDYPLCWRDKTPLLMVSRPQWFFKISEIQKKILKENEEVNWNPRYMKMRMKAWLEGVGDWPVSRQRYWGTPLPIWHDQESGERIVVGSLEELKKLSGKSKINLHKPEIDEITIKSKSGKILRRVPEVLDVWFDSGVSSWAALEYPKEKEKLKRYWPADLNIEGTDQFRGWWNSQMILSEITFGKKPFENIIVHGMILDLGKSKMSKSLGNIISPEEVIGKYGRDYLRYYFAKTSRGEDFSYDEREFNEIRKFFTILINVHNYTKQLERKKSSKAAEDDWLNSKFNSLINEVIDDYNNFRFPDAIQKLGSFLMNDLSRTYIQITRERSDETSDLLMGIFIDFIKLLSPICPFMCESFWSQLKGASLVKEDSIFLAEPPRSAEKKIDKKLENEFSAALLIIEKGLAERDKEKIGLRWPLTKAIIYCDAKIDDKIAEIIARQLNVRKVEIKKSDKERRVELDTKMTPELEAEGFTRELARKIQEYSKKAGLKKQDKIDLAIYSDDKLSKLIQSNLDFLKERINASKIILANKKSSSMKSISIKNSEVFVDIERK